jgi:hypothetical protein
MAKRWYLIAIALVGFGIAAAGPVNAGTEVIEPTYAPRQTYYAPPPARPIYYAPAPLVSVVVRPAYPFCPRPFGVVRYHRFYPRHHWR